MKDPKLDVINQVQLIEFKGLGDVKMFVLTSKNFWQAEMILLYLIDASNSVISFSIGFSTCFLKSMNNVFPELDIDFKSLLFEFPYISPIFIDCSFGPLYIFSLFSQNLI